MARGPRVLTRPGRRAALIGGLALVGVACELVGFWPLAFVFWVLALAVVADAAERPRRGRW